MNVLRVWSTCLTLATLEQLESTWLVDPDARITIVDHTRVWLDRQAEDDPRLRKILPEVMARARACVRCWNEAFLDRLNMLRDKENEVNRFGLNAQKALEASGTVIKSLREDHETFSVIMSDCMTGLTRWQRWMVIMSLVLSGLLVTIWFYSSRATNCCFEVRPWGAQRPCGPPSGAHQCLPEGLAPKPGDVTAAASIRARKSPHLLLLVRPADPKLALVRAGSENPVPRLYG